MLLTMIHSSATRAQGDSRRKSALRHVLCGVAMQERSPPRISPSPSGRLLHFDSAREEDGVLQVNLMVQVAFEFCEFLEPSIQSKEGGAGSLWSSISV